MTSCSSLFKCIYMQDQIDRIDKELNSANAVITKSKVAIKTAERYKS